MMWWSAVSSLFIVVACCLSMGFTAKPLLSQVLNPTWSRSVQLYQQPHALWLDQDAQVGANLGKLLFVLGVAAQRKQIPELVLYAVPIRDLGQSSEGGFADFESYMAENRALAKHMAHFVRHTGLHPRLYLEPDGLALALQYRQDSHDNAESQRIYQQRVNGFKTLVTLYQQAGVSVFMDAGHSGWFGHSATDIARIAHTLNEAGIANADGVVSNISNRQPLINSPLVANQHNPTGQVALNEQAYLSALLPLLDNKQLTVVIDTSRNGQPITHFKTRTYQLQPNGVLTDNGGPNPQVDRQVGRWQPEGDSLLLYPLFGPPKRLSRLLAKEKYQYDANTKTLMAPPWLDPLGDVVTGTVPQNNVSTVRITGAKAVEFRYVKPPDDCDGSLNCPPGQSKHDITAMTQASQP
jgi:hypothetical protein